MTQDILITPGSGEPQILFRGSGTNDTPIELNVLSSYQSATGSGTALVFEGQEGQLFAVTDNLSSGTIFSVGDITGLSMLSVDASGDVKLGEFANSVIVYPGLTLDDNVPSTTSNVLYNDGGDLMWNGVTVIQSGAAQAVDGSGTASYVARFTDTNTLGTGVIYDNGTNVGIGTASPSQKLHIDEGNIRIEKTTDPTLEFNDGSANRASMWYDTSEETFVLNHADADLNQLVLTSGNDVGIGTNAPNASLHVYSAVSGDNVFNVEGTNGSLFGVTDNLSGVLMSVNTIAGLPVLEVNSDYSLTAGRFNQNDFTISSSGDIGIGTASPASPAKLVVKTSALADEAVRVYNSDNIETFTLGHLGDNSSYFAMRDDAGNVGVNLRTDTYDNYIAYGNFGLGTTTPSEKLHVYGTAAGDGALIGNAKIGVYDGSTDYALFAHNSVHTSTTSYALLQKNDGNTFLNAATNAYINFRINNANAMTVYPDKSVKMYGDSTNSTWTNASPTLAIKRSTSSPYISFHSDTGTRLGYLQFDANGVNGIVGNNYQDFVFHTNSLERMKIHKDGYVNFSNYLRIDYTNDERAIVFEDSGGTDTIYMTVNDGQGNFNMMLGVNHDGNRIATGDGTAKFMLGGHSTDGFASMNAGLTGTAGASAVYNIGLGVFSFDQTLRIGNPNDNVGLATYGATSGVPIADVDGDLITRYLRARDANGIQIGDDSDTLGIFVKDGGSVGIGTTSPQQKLHIVGDQRIENATDPKLEFHDGAAVGAYVKFDTSEDNLVLSHVDVAGDNQIALANDGNVGIGTASPNAVLHAYGSTPSGTVFNVEGTNGSLFSVVDNLSGVLMSVNNNAGLPVFEVNDDDSIIAGRFAQDDFVITSSGDIGMGTANPASKLEVNGTVTATCASLGQLNVDNLRLDGNTLSSTNTNGNINITPNGTGGIAGGANATVTGSYAVVGGGLNNSTSSSYYGMSTVSGGGYNNASEDYSTVSGGYSNTASGYSATIGGGYGSTASGNVSTVGGGGFNIAYGNSSVISGGANNKACAHFSSVSGGNQNFVNARHGSINGGHFNVIQSPTNECCARGATIGGGVGHNTSGGTLDVTTGDLTGTITCCNAGAFSTISGGLRNCATGNCSTVSGGAFNTASGYYSTVSGGGGFFGSHIASGNYSTVSGGYGNCASGPVSTVGGGQNNCASGNYSTVSGGGGFFGSQTASGAYSTVGGGQSNCASGSSSTVSGGQSNIASGSYSVVAGGGGAFGGGNTASGSYSTVSGGTSNTASGTNSSVSGGGSNSASASYSTVSGGSNNTASATSSTVGGGFFNCASGTNSSVSGGCCNITNARHSTINGGHRNIIQSPTNECCSRGATIGGGIGHNTSGGTVNSTTGDITGTVTCCNAGRFSTISGGLRNCASGNCSSITGGSCNTDSGYSNVHILGSNITATAADTTYTENLHVTCALKINKFDHTNLSVASSFADTDVLVAVIDPTGTASTEALQGSVLRSSLLNQPAELQFRQGTDAERQAITPASGEPIWTTDTEKFYIGNGTTCGGLLMGPTLHERGSGTCSIVAKNTGNTASGNYSTVSGGTGNCASGNCSTVSGGKGNSASGYGSTIGGGGVIIFGSGHNASGSFSTIGGGGGLFGGANTASGNNSTISGGYSNCASGNYSTVSGGYSNSASGNYSTVSGGAVNTASGIVSTVGGGASNCASAIHSTVGGGASNCASASYSTVGGGYYAKASKYGELSHAAGRFAQTGDAQHSTLIARRNTTNATANQVLFLDGSSTRLTIPAETTWMFEIKLAAYNDTNNDGAWWTFRGGIKRNAANGTSLIGTVIEENSKDTNMSTASASVVADDTNEALEIRVTGVASKNIRWVAVVDISQVSWGTP